MEQHHAKGTRNATLDRQRSRSRSREKRNKRDRRHWSRSRDRGTKRSRDREREHHSRQKQNNSSQPTILKPTLDKLGQAEKCFYEHFLGVFVTLNAIKMITSFIPALVNAKVRKLKVKKKDGSLRPDEFHVITEGELPFIEIDRHFINNNLDHENLPLKKIGHHIFSVTKRSGLQSSGKKIKVSHDYVEVFAVHYFGTPTFGKDSLRIKNWEWEYENNEFGIEYSLTEPPRGSDIELKGRAELAASITKMWEIGKFLGLIPESSRPTKSADIENEKKREKYDKYLNTRTKKSRYSTEEKKNYEEKSDMYENYLNTGPKEAQRKKKGETRMSSDEKMKLAWDSEAVRNDEEKSDSFQNW